MGKASRDKGAREERALVNRWRAEGISAQRVPLSGGTEFQKGDVQISGFIGELKVRQNGGGFKSLYDWLGDNDFLTVKQSGRGRLYVLSEDAMIALAKQGGWK
jgi:hypothetical protein